MIKRALLPVAIVAVSGFLFEASAADPVIAHPSAVPRGDDNAGRGPLYGA